MWRLPAPQPAAPAFTLKSMSKVVVAARNFRSARYMGWTFGAPEADIIEVLLSHFKKSVS
jgi:hypothetical protein